MLPRFCLLSRLAPCAALLTLLTLGGCQSLLDARYRDSVPPTQGTLTFPELSDSASVRRNALGMPLIEAHTLPGALFTLGYVHASDRLSQMVGMRLMASGRLAEMVGPGVLEIDRFMRTVNLRQSAEVLYRHASPELKALFATYAKGVNAYLHQHRDTLPMDLAESGHQPAEWQAEDSVLIFCLLNFGLAVNLREEIAGLVLAQKVGTEKLAWLLPVYPDEPLPFDEADKLKGLDLAGKFPGLASLEQTARELTDLNMLGVAASNNWAVAPSRSRSGKSLLANDTHLPLAMPSMWNFVHLRTPHFQAAGVSVAGVPAVVAGYNGSLGWGMTMVMGDNQDLFLERLKDDNGRLLYLADGQWQPTRERYETFFIKGQRPVRELIHETRNGPLLNGALRQSKHMLQPQALTSRYGLAYRSVQVEADQSLDAFFKLSMAQTVDQAFEATREVRAMPLNIVFADAQNIAWQVTGRYPNRRAGRGLLPTPGGDNAYAWDGFAGPDLHPYDQNPQQGWLGTANHRSVPSGYGVQLSNSWYYPERAERIGQWLDGTSGHDTQDMIAMQYDQSSPFVAKLQAMLTEPGMGQALEHAILALPATPRDHAREALSRLLAFDGQLTSDSADAALYGAFLHESARQTFLDELGPDDSPAWQALVSVADSSYSAQADHMLGRDDSPFWDNIHTAEHEDKAVILARSLAGAVALLEKRLGRDRGGWQWGALHRYTWTTDTSKLAPYMGTSERIGIKALDSYLNRGPYPAGGDHSTLNVSAYHWGQGFDTWLIPAMRIIVDFGRDEPLIGLNSSGQSGNPASPHYADGIEAWRHGDYQSFPFKAENLQQVYGAERLLLVPDR
jgi:acyl-homoserine-lactone acylase